MAESMEDYGLRTGVRLETKPINECSHLFRNRHWVNEQLEELGTDHKTDRKDLTWGKPNAIKSKPGYNPGSFCGLVH